MKCPICNGKGTQFIADYDGMYDIVCDKCKGKGELDENGKPILTNEEYLKSCDTEEFAEWIASEINERVKLALHDSELNDGDVDADFYMEDSDDWKEWLKQPHSFE